MNSDRKKSTHSSEITNTIINSISSRLNEIQKTNLIKLDEWLDIKCSVNVGVYEERRKEEMKEISSMLDYVHFALVRCTDQSHNWSAITSFRTIGWWIKHERNCKRTLFGDFHNFPSNFLSQPKVIGSLQNFSF